MMVGAAPEPKRTRHKAGFVSIRDSQDHQNGYGSTPDAMVAFLVFAYTLLPRREKYQMAAMTMMISRITHQ
jgi:hypothetical protein